MKALKREGDEDYKLRRAHNNVWITVGNVSVNILRRDWGVAVDLYPLHREGEDALAGTTVLFTDANL